MPTVKKVKRAKRLTVPHKSEVPVKKTRSLIKEDFGGKKTKKEEVEDIFDDDDNEVVEMEKEFGRRKAMVEEDVYKIEEKVMEDRDSDLSAMLSKKEQKNPAKKVENRSSVDVKDAARKISRPSVSRNLEEKMVNGNRSISSYRKMAFAFVFLTAMLLAAVFYLSYAKVSIILTTGKELVSDSLVLDVYDKEKMASKTPKEDNFEGAVKRIKIEDEKEFEASGASTFGEEVTGKVVIYNNYIKNQPLVATTRIVSPDEKMFRLKTTVNVPAGGSVEVEVYADKPSEDMALEPTRFSIPGLWAGLQDKIFARSSEKFSYNRQSKKIIKQEDIDLAIRGIKLALTEKAKKEVGDTYQNSYSEVMYDLDNNSLVLNIDSKVGAEKDSFKVKAAAMVNVVAFPKEKMAEKAKAKLDAIIPSNKELLSFDPDKITYSLSNTNYEQGLATVNVSFDSQVALKNGVELVDKNKIVNLTEQQLKKYLNGIQEISSYKIVFTPSFINKTPSLADKIEVKVAK